MAEQPRLGTYLCRYGASRAEAEDAMVDAFVALYRNWRTVTNPAVGLPKASVRILRPRECNQSGSKGPPRG